ncbi:MAG: A/G-specific adenine glycosylase [Pseudomonadales bacterium]|nr:A/G-specific adenine glycosylase [Pseudomonadales bacterium]
MAEAYHSQAHVGFAARLLAWWDEHGRKDLPWQHPRTPYRVWVSEIMLQQTQVTTVIPYFRRFMTRFPDVHSLAGSDLDEVLHYWSGLGYYARARNLHRAALLVADELGGVLPETPNALQELPGVGRSTAAAIAAQAYGIRAPILDGNVKRVLARQHRLPGPVSSSKTQKELWRLAERHTPRDRVADYTQAIMDLGATICRRARPQCSLCPVRGSCQALATRDVERFPERAGGRNRRLERRRYFVLVEPAGRCLVERRPELGIWGGLWSPPEREANETLESFLAVAGIHRDLVDEVHAGAPFRHGFSHFDLAVEPVYVRLKAVPTAAHERGGRWIRPGEHALGLSAVAAKLIEANAW